MGKTYTVEAAKRALGTAFFPGDRVRVWYRSERRWKAATVRALILEPPPTSRTYYQIRCDGKDNPRYYRAEELRPLG
ncbi:MAG: hypothetical protein M5U08_11820 [Burkholderiales bacterium]|nr:hypothetical protein [Burkholderiales bacterium]